MKNLIGKLRIEDPVAYQQMMKSSGKNAQLNQKVFAEQVKQMK